VLIDNKNSTNNNSEQPQQRQHREQGGQELDNLSDTCTVISSGSSSFGYSNNNNDGSDDENPAEEYLRSVFVDSTPEQRKRFVRCHMNLEGYDVGGTQYQEDLNNTETLLRNYLAFRKQYNFDDELDHGYEQQQDGGSSSFEEMDKADWDHAWSVAWKAYRERSVEEYFPEEGNNNNNDQPPKQQQQSVNEGYMVPQYVFSYSNNDNERVLINNETPTKNEDKHYFVLTCVPGLIDVKNVPSVELHGLAVALYMERKFQNHQRLVLQNDRDTFRFNFLIDCRGGKGWPNETPMKLYPLIKFVTKILTSLFGDRLNKLISAPVPFFLTSVYNMISTYYFQGYLASKAVLISGSNSDTKGLQNKLSASGDVCEDTFVQIENKRQALQQNKGGKKRR